MRRLLVYDRQRGFVLILVTILMLTMLGFLIYGMMATISELRRSRSHRDKVKTLYSAEGALNKGMHSIATGFLDPTDPRFVEFDPLDPQTVFKRYVDDTVRGLGRYLEREGSRTYLLEGAGMGTIDYKVVVSGMDKLWQPVEGEVSEDGGSAADLFSKPLRFGRNVEVKSTGKNRAGIRSTVKQHIVLSYLPNIIFKYGMLTNRLKECQFCHMHVRGDLGQVGGEHFSPISPHITRAKIDGNLLLSGEYRLDQHPAHKQQLDVVGQVIERSNDPAIMPTSWPSILSRIDPERPSMAGFYIDLAEKAFIAGSSYIQGGDIQANYGEVDRFKRVDYIRGVFSGNVVLTGTPSNPLRIRGPIVIRGDAVIRGHILGQGSLYVERNIYVVDDVLYSNRPDEQEWLNVFAAELAKRRSARSDPNFRFDKLGLFAGGNVIVGNLAHPTVFKYLQHFLNYESSGMVESRGNSKGYDPLGLYAMDGGAGQRKTLVRHFEYVDRFEDGSDYDKDGIRSWGEGIRWRRKDKIELHSTGLLPKGAGSEDFSGGWLSRDKFSELAEQGAKSSREKINQVSTIDATIYTDGAFTGYKPSNDKGKSERAEYQMFGDVDGDGFTFNGAVIARDIDVLAPGGWYVRYDNRNYVGEGSTINFEPSRMVEISGWREQ